MSRKSKPSTIPAGALLFLALTLTTFPGSGNTVRGLLRNRIITAGFPVKIAVGEEHILASSLVPLFYKQRNFEPAWSRGRVLMPEADSLLSSIGKARLEGLDPEDYHLARLSSVVHEIELGETIGNLIDSRVFADSDILLTDAFFMYATHLSQGKVDAESGSARWGWSGRDEDLDLIQVLERALADRNVERAFQELLPKTSFYLNTRRALDKYRKLGESGGWPRISSGPKIQKGEKSKRVAELRRRLLASDDSADSGSGRSDVFDENLVKAVRHFQSRHGLEVSGDADEATLAALEIPIQERIGQIEINLDRWRWLPRNLGDPYILANIANFELGVFEHSKRVMNMKIVAGTLSWATPDFNSRMIDVVINPYWYIPPHVFWSELINYARQDSNYFKTNKIKVLKGWGAKEKEIDPKTINWAEVEEKTAMLHFRQEPGAFNMLGTIKFTFPNKYDIFLHDTPYREDFGRVSRIFSHGCIRAEKPLELAVYVLRNNPGWNKGKILEAISQNKEQTVKLETPIDVHFIYSTAWAEEDGTVQFRPDIYGRDKALLRALGEGPAFKWIGR